MDLLMEIKHLYSLLLDLGLVDKKPELNELEEIAEECFHKKYKRLNGFLVPGLSKDNYDEIKNYINKIKELSE